MNAKQRRRAEREQARTASAPAPASESDSESSSNVVAMRPTPGVSVPVVKGEKGISGTTNWDGRLAVEATTALRWQAAFGTAGRLEFGEWEKLVRTDPAAAKGLEMVAAPLREATIDVKPVDDTPEATAVAEFVRDNLQKWLEPTWAEFINQEVKSALTYGFALHEVVYGTRPDPRVPGGTAVYVAKLAQRLASSIKENGWVERDGELAEVRQHGVRNEKWEEAIVLPAEHLHLLTWNREGNNYAGFSAFRPVWYIAKQRAELVKIIAIGHQREALGIPIATMDANVDLNPTQRTALQTLVENLVYHENAAAQLPPGVKLDFLFSQGSNKGHLLEAWSRFGLALLDVLFAEQSYLGTSDTGSRSVGEVHADAKTQFVLGVKALVESVLNGTGRRPYTGLVPKIVRPNFGDLAEYPTVTLVMKKADVDIGKLAAAVPSLVTAGALTLQFEDELAIRERLGLSPIDEADWEAERTRKDEMAAQIAGVVTEGAGDEDEDDDEADDEAADADKSKAPPPPKPPMKFADAPFIPKRPLFAQEQHIAFSEMDEFITTSRERFEKDAKDIIAVMVAAALPQIREAMKDGDPSELATVQLDTSRLRKLCAAFVARARAEGYRQVAKERAAQTGRPLQFAAEEDDKYPPPTPSEPDVAPQSPPGPKAKRAVTLDAAQTSRLTSRIANRVSDDMLSQAMLVARTRGTADDVTTAVLSQVLDTRGLRADAGSVLTTTFNMGREQFAEEHADEVQSVHISAVMDRNTCDYCRGQDGRELEFGSDEEEEMTPPLAGCEGGDADRCIKVFSFRK